MKNLFKTMIPSKKFSKIFLKIAIPIIFAQLLTVTVGFVDNFMVGHYRSPSSGTINSSTVALASIMIGSEINFAATSIFMSLGFVFQMLLSQLFGAKMKKTFKDVQKTSFVISGLFGIFFLLLMFYAPTPLVKIFNKEDIRVIEAASSYVKLMSISVFLTAISYVYLNGIIAIGKSKWLLLTSTVSLILNIILDYIFIYVLDMGLVGAAIATIIATGVGLIIYFYIAFIHNSWLSIPINLLKYNLKVLKQILSKWAATLGQICFLLAFPILSIVYSNAYGVEVQAALGPGAAIVGAIFVIFPAIGSATKVIIGHELGSNNFTIAWENSKKSIFITLYLSLLSAAFGIILGWFLPGAIGASGQALFYARRLVMIFALASPFYSLASMLFGCLEAGFKTTASAIFKNYYQIFIILPVAILFAFSFKVDFLWTLFVAQMMQIIPTGFSFFFYSKKKWLVNITDIHKKNNVHVSY